MDIDQIIQKIPKPVLAIVVLVGALAFFIYTDPLRDECEMQTAIFEKKTEGLISAVKMKKGIQYPKITYSKSRCRKGNSIGSCDEYLEGLRILVKEWKAVSPKCQPKYVEANPGLLEEVKDAVIVISLVAWGEKPPRATSERLGWINESNLRTFCYLKSSYEFLAGKNNLTSIKNTVYEQYPGNWPENYNFDELIKNSDSQDKKVMTDFEKQEATRRMVDENRPRAYKTAANPMGQLSEEEVYNLSLFSIRCDLYL